MLKETKLPVYRVGGKLRIRQATRMAICERLSELTKGLHPSVPLDEMFEACRAYGLEAVDEANEPWVGFLCGQDGNVHIDLLSLDLGEVVEERLQVSWYRLQSGRVEVTAYVL